MIDRSKAPALSSLTSPTVLDYEKRILKNGAEIFILNDPKQEVFKLDITFQAGVYYQSTPLLASATINMLNEGTSKHSSAELAEAFDFYGAFIEFNCGMHSSEISLFAMNKYASEVLDIIQEILLESIFPEEELRIFLKNKKQSFLTQKEKTNWLAQKEFLKRLFGEKYPYTNTIEAADYDRLDILQVRQYFKERYTAENCRVILAGHISDSIRKRIEDIISQLPSGKNKTENMLHEFMPSSPGHYHAKKENAAQTSIRIGKEGVALNHPDYPGFQLLNTVLGGYFGSRLMSNIREEKGYTYGISSFNANFQQASYWCIVSDVNQEYAEATQEEIRKEINLLRTTPVDIEELNTVKNYFYGELLRELDGVFSQSDSLKSKLIHGFDNRFYLFMIEQIKTCSSDQLLELANKYLNMEQMYFITSGS